MGKIFTDLQWHPHPSPTLLLSDTNISTLWNQFHNTANVEKWKGMENWVCRVPCVYFTQNDQIFIWPFYSRQNQIYQKDNHHHQESPSQEGCLQEDHQEASCQEDSSQEGTRQEVRSQVRHKEVRSQDRH